MALEIYSYLVKSTGGRTFPWTLCVWFRLSQCIPDLASKLPLEVMALSSLVRKIILTITSLRSDECRIQRKRCSHISSVLSARGITELLPG